MTLENLLAWWNLIFIVPGLLAVLYLTLFVFSGLEAGPGQADADADADADVHADADAGADISADTDADADISAEADADADVDVAADVSAEAEASADAADGAHAVSAHIGAPVYFTVLSWLGLGRVPLSLMAMSLLLFWGIVGFAVNTAMRPRLEAWGLAALLPFVSVPAALLGSALLTALFARVVGRWFPLAETYAQRKQELLGLEGEALYPIDQKFGMAFVRDSRGEVFQLPCRRPAVRGQAAPGRGRRPVQHPPGRGREGHQNGRRHGRAGESQRRTGPRRRGAAESGQQAGVRGRRPQVRAGETAHRGRKGSAHPDRPGHGPAARDSFCVGWSQDGRGGASFGTGEDARATTSRRGFRSTGILRILPVPWSLAFWRLCPDGQHGRERLCHVVRRRDPGPPAAETVTRPWARCSPRRRCRFSAIRIR